MAEKPSEGLIEAVESGEYRRGLEALRRVLADSIAEVDPHLRAPLAKQLSDVMTRLEGLPPVEKESRLDELARRRADRRGEVPDGAGKAKQRRPGSG